MVDKVAVLLAQGSEFNPSTHIKIWIWWFVIPALNRKRKKDFGVCLSASQAWLEIQRIQWDNLFKIKVDGSWAPVLETDFCCIYACTQMYTSTTNICEHIQHTSLPTYEMMFMLCLPNIFYLNKNKTKILSFNSMLASINQ